MGSRYGGLAVRLAIYAGVLCGGLYFLQQRQLYQPTPLPLADAIAEGRAAGLAPWPSAQQYRGLVREPAEGAGVRATLVLFHGNAGHAAHRSEYAERLGALGLRVILAEYPGYGPRTGEASESVLVGDGLETLKIAHELYRGSLLLAGESLGAAVAAAVEDAADRAGLRSDGLLLITPWDTLASAAKQHYPWLPVEWLLRERYDTVQALAKRGLSRGPLAVVVADADAIVPAVLGRRLYERLPPPKRLFALPRAGHNDWIEATDERWWRELTEFLLGASIGEVTAPAKIQPPR
ncbi:MAG: alpha/beta hydrolase [Rhodocyclaceae bacterium]|nr:alpha/beta hydrolase [Rhodocyclaceae bacterium]